MDTVDRYPDGDGQVQGNGVVTIAGSGRSQHQTIQVLVLDRASVFGDWQSSDLWGTGEQGLINW